ncbi:MAG: UDP-N-acetylmuramate dehydrogenase [Aquificaceae bacterium]|nr:UDP-N-acetylmuramate dehydrogenase [Aquificaceae bacterium]MCX8059922.1 UDP-N-acetylmuramate dehydrogenase [Aquificaceae bacterium]MDW8097711.1 UDP-N-acetylmuramate dehydrogenase [Aquificaceae bacterium]
MKLKTLTTIGIGGTASWFAEPIDVSELRECLRFALDNSLEVFPLGRGANTIFGDFDGLVLSTRRLKGIKVERKEKALRVEVMAGTPLSELVNLSLRENLEGFYRLAGFPATVGGAVAMNAGAFGYETSRHLVELEFMDWESRVHAVKASELEFSYRSSPFPEMGIVVSAVFELPFCAGSVREEYQRVVSRRKSTQPINVPTSGSTFKNPPGDYAGRLLEKVGMKGYRVGDVAFSDLHANFLVNLGNGSYTQVVKILEEAKRRVYEEFGITLQEEVKLVESGCADGRKV